MFSSRTNRTGSAGLPPKSGFVGEGRLDVDAVEAGIGGEDLLDRRAPLLEPPDVRRADARPVQARTTAEDARRLDDATDLLRGTLVQGAESTTPAAIRAVHQRADRAPAEARPWTSTRTERTAGEVVQPATIAPTLRLLLGDTPQFRSDGGLVQTALRDAHGQLVEGVRRLV